MPDVLLVGVTVEQSWQPFPGGTAASTNALLRELRRDPGLRLLGIAARHRSPAATPWHPDVDVHHLPLPRAALYPAWHHLRWPPVDVGRPRGHTPVQVIHATSPAIPPGTAPLVATIHDLAFLDEPRWYTPRGLRFFRRGTDLARRHARRIVVPSTHTRDDCIRAGFNPTVVRVIPHGVSVPDVPAPDIQALRRRFAITRPYILWCGTHEPRKNLPGLLAAFAALVADDDPGVDLVLVGPFGWGPASAPPARVAGRVRHTGFLTSAELHAAYAGAAAFCYPSLREGFGMPVLEAMAHGLPVVTSRASPMADIAGPAAEAVDPADSAALAAALRTVLRHPEPYREAARERSRSYTWAGAAASLAAVYREAAADAARIEST